MASWAASNFLLDLALLWATGRISGSAASGRRLLLGAACGTAWFVLVPAAAVPPASVLAILAIPGLMLWVAFAPRSLRALGTLAAVFYAVAFVAAGAGALVCGLVGSPAPGPALAGAAAALGTMGWVALAGLYPARRMAVLAALRVRVHLRFGCHWVTRTGLVDTGNRLKDPLGQLPVVLMWHGSLQGVLPQALRPLVESLSAGQLQGIGRLAQLDPRWGARFRVVPFRSVGSQHGLLAGLRADEMVLELPGGTRVRGGPVVVALSPTPLGDGGDFDALVPADCLLATAALATSGKGRRAVWAWKGGAAGAATGS